MKVIQNINAPVYGNVAGDSIHSSENMRMTMTRQHLIDAFPDNVHLQLHQILAESGVSASDLLQAQRIGALDAVNGQIRRKGRFVDQGVGYLMVVACIVGAILIGHLTYTSKTTEALAGLGFIGVLLACALVITGKALYPQRVAARVERFLSERNP